jgi:prephenate dehydrogenase
MQMANEYSSEYLGTLLSKAEKIRALIEERDVQAFEVFYDKLQKKLSKSVDLTRMYQKTYAALKAMEK